MDYATAVQFYYFLVPQIAQFDYEQHLWELKFHLKRICDWKAFSVYPHQVDTNIYPSSFSAAQMVSTMTFCQPYLCLGRECFSAREKYSWETIRENEMDFVRSKYYTSSLQNTSGSLIINRDTRESFMNSLFAIILVLLGSLPATFCGTIKRNLWRYNLSV